METNQKTNDNLQINQSKLSPRETEVVGLVLQGKSNKQIAQDLNLSEGTVRNYLSTVFSKLGVESRVEAALHWMRRQTGS